MEDKAAKYAAKAAALQEKADRVAAKLAAQAERAARRAERQQKRQQRKYQKDAAVVVQRLVRGWVCRGKDELERRRSALLKLQTFARMVIAKRHRRFEMRMKVELARLAQRKRAARSIAVAYALHRNRQIISSSLARLLLRAHESALRVQRWWAQIQVRQRLYRSRVLQRATRLLAALRLRLAIPILLKKRALRLKIRNQVNSDKRKKKTSDSDSRLLEPTRPGRTAGPRQSYAAQCRQRGAETAKRLGAQRKSQRPQSPQPSAVALASEKEALRIVSIARRETVAAKPPSVRPEVHSAPYNTGRVKRNAPVPDPNRSDKGHTTNTGVAQAEKSNPLPRAPAPPRMAFGANTEQPSGEHGPPRSISPTATKEGRISLHSALRTPRSETDPKIARTSRSEAELPCHDAAQDAVGGGSGGRGGMRHADSQSEGPTQDRAHILAVQQARRAAMHRKTQEAAEAAAAAQQQKAEEAAAREQQRLEWIRTEARRRAAEAEATRQREAARAAEEEAKKQQEQIAAAKLQAEKEQKEREKWRRRIAKAKAIEAAKQRAEEARAAALMKEKAKDLAEKKRAVQERIQAKMREHAAEKAAQAAAESQKREEEKLRLAKIAEEAAAAKKAAVKAAARKQRQEAETASRERAAQEEQARLKAQQLVEKAQQQSEIKKLKRKKKKKKNTTPNPTEGESPELPPADAPSRADPLPPSPIAYEAEDLGVSAADELDLGGTVSLASHDPDPISSAARASSPIAVLRSPARASEPFASSFGGADTQRPSVHAPNDFVPTHQLPSTLLGGVLQQPRPPVGGSAKAGRPKRSKSRPKHTATQSSLAQAAAVFGGTQRRKRKAGRSRAHDGDSTHTPMDSLQTSITTASEPAAEVADGPVASEQGVPLGVYVVNGSIRPPRLGPARSDATSAPLQPSLITASVDSLPSPTAPMTAPAPSALDLLNMCMSDSGSDSDSG